MSEKDAYIQHLENTIKDLEHQVSNLTEMVLLLRKDKFGPSSEKTTVQIEGQLSLFNEAELEADPDVPEPAHFRKGCVVTRNRKTNREELLKDIPVVEFPCMVHPDEMYCGECGGSLKEIGFTKVRVRFNISLRRLKSSGTCSRPANVLLASIATIPIFRRLRFPNPS